MTRLYFSNTPTSWKRADALYLDEIHGEWQDEVTFEQRAIVRELRESGDWPPYDTLPAARYHAHMMYSPSFEAAVRTFNRVVDSIS